MLKIKYDRYCPKECIGKFKKSDIKVIGKEVLLGFELDDEEFEIYFPETGDMPNSELLLTAEEVLEHISIFDNLVQESCAEECERTGIDSRDYELYLAYINIDKDIAQLRYYGLRVNTEWEAHFSKTDSGWEKSNF